MHGTSPNIEGNRCYKNDMAGIGSRDGAGPIIRNNQCSENNMAGIGSDGAKNVLITQNECRNNQMAGIGVKNKASVMILNNKCINNKLVAIGVIRQSKAHIENNDLSRNGGVPPLVAVKDGSSATLRKNKFEGGGVAGVLVQGDVLLENNSFGSTAKKQGTAIWVWAQSRVAVLNNNFFGYRNAIRATKAKAIVMNNTIQKFEKTAIVIQQPTSPSYVINNVAYGVGTNQRVVESNGEDNVVKGNILKGNPKKK